jgi:hypothetical protein
LMKEAVISRTAVFPTSGPSGRQGKASLSSDPTHVATGSESQTFAEKS